MGWLNFTIGTLGLIASLWAATFYPINYDRKYEHLNIVSIGRYIPREQEYDERRTIQIIQTIKINYSVCHPKEREITHVIITITTWTKKISLIFSHLFELILTYYLIFNKRACLTSTHFTFLFTLNMIEASRRFGSIFLQTQIIYSLTLH